MNDFCSRPRQARPETVLTRCASRHVRKARDSCPCENKAEGVNVPCFSPKWRWSQIRPHRGLGQVLGPYGRIYEPPCHLRETLGVESDGKQDYMVASIIRRRTPARTLLLACLGIRKRNLLQELQGYLAHEKQPTPRTLQQDHA